MGLNFFWRAIPIACGLTDKCRCTMFALKPGSSNWPNLQITEHDWVYFSICIFLIFSRPKAFSPFSTISSFFKCILQFKIYVCLFDFHNPPPEHIVFQHVFFTFTWDLLNWSWQHPLHFSGPLVSSHPPHIWCLATWLILSLGAWNHLSAVIISVCQACGKLFACQECERVCRLTLSRWCRVPRRSARACMSFESNVLTCKVHSGENEHTALGVDLPYVSRCSRDDTKGIRDC